MSLEDNMVLYWSVSNDNITFGIDVVPPSSLYSDGLGWAAIGLSPAGGMYGADMMVVVRDSSPGKWRVEDRFAVEPDTPALDSQQDLTLLMARATGRRGIRAMFTRKLAACDRQDFPIDQGLPVQVIHAYGSTWGYHGGFRGENVIDLWPKPQTPSVASSSSSSSSSSSTSAKTKRRQLQQKQGAKAAAADLTVDVTMPNVTVPTRQDTYLCVDVLLPRDRQYHITGFEGLRNQTGGSYYHVHHMLLFSCTSRPKSFGNGTYRCDGMPAECLSFVVTWTPGTGRISFPPEAGFLMGPGGFEYAALQMHYYNLDAERGVLDSSGMRLFYSPQLRPNELGVLVVGSVGFNIPRLSALELAPAVCPSVCTNKFNGTLQIVNTLLHMHKVGTSIVLQHIRNGIELRPIAQRQYYSFNYQPSVGVPSESSRLLPGDTLITRCVYNNRRNITVRFGEGTDDEMCFSFLTVWPKSALNGIDACLSSGYRSGVLAPLVNTTLCSQFGVLTSAWTGGSSGGLAAAFAVLARALIPNTEEMVREGRTYVPFNPQCVGGKPAV